MHTEAGIKYYSLRTLNLTSRHKFETVHESTAVTNELGRDEAVHCDDLVQKMGELATRIVHTTMGSLNPTLSPEALQLMNTSTSHVQQTNAAVHIQPGAAPTQLDAVPAEARAQFLEAITTATRQGRVGLQRMAEVKPFDKDKAQNLKDLLAQLTTMKNSVQHVLDFSEDTDGTVLTDEKLSVYMKDFASILTKVSLALTDAQNVIKAYAQPQPPHGLHTQKC